MGKNAFSSAGKPLDFSAALLLAGEGPATQQLDLLLPPRVREQLCWVAADGGMDFAAQYRAPVTAVLGDFDSIQNREGVLQGGGAQTIHRFDPAKDETDRNLALNYLAEKKHRHIVQIGGGGGRSDHFLAMITDYRLQRFPVMPKLWFTRCEAIVYLEAGERVELVFHVSDAAAAAALVSSFPLDNSSVDLSEAKHKTPTILQSKNLKWPLSTLCTEPKHTQNTALPYSLSNWATSERVQVLAVQGRALIFCPYYAESPQYPENPASHLCNVQIFLP